jgi:hypothetical protein
MSVLAIDLNRHPARRRKTPRRLLRGLAQRFDALVAYAVKHAVSEHELRRADADIRRCRDLIARKDVHRDVHLRGVRIKPLRVKVV